MNVFCKSLLTSALVTTTLSSAYAADPITVYGKLNITAQSNDEDGEQTTTIQSNASRLGVKGAFELKHNLEAFYTVEYEVATGDDDKENFKARNQIVGLKGSFGSVAIGRNDTMVKKAQGKMDYFNEYSGDLKNLFKGENRPEQTAEYVTPSFNHFRVGVTYAAEGSASQYGQNGYSLAAMYGDAKFKKSPVYISVAYDSAVKGYDVLQATVQGKIANLRLAAMYQQQEETFDSDGNAIEDSETKKGYLLSASYAIDDVLLKGQYQELEDKGDSWSVGADYKLGKPTMLFAFYTSRSLEGFESSDKYIGLGLEHKF
ncbi:porin [Shewanella youngdeokensis]|uniref:Porin n=1 Tax=Shewanella youngdeokensis TaxID=2999068 RepID=A0ABZ0JVR1_9GAMM|nr:porin [Shewanella sp. DAU334]